MKKHEILTVRDYADHFDGDLRMAALAHHFGLGVVLMKKESLLDTVTDEDKEAVRTIYDEISAEAPAKSAVASGTKRRSAKARLRSGKRMKPAAVLPPAAAAKPKGLSRMNRAELETAAAAKGVNITDLTNAGAVKAIRARG